MTPETVINIGHQALELTVMLAAPMLGAALGIGLIVGIFQAATQIQEMTLSFIPKLLALVIALFWSGAWMLTMTTEFSIRLFNEIPALVG